MKTTLETLMKFGAKKTKDKRGRERSQCDQNESQCDTEIEKEKDIEKELYSEKRRTTSSFSDEKKGGSYERKNNFYNNSYYGKNKPPEKPASYDIEEVGGDALIDPKVLI